MLELIGKKALITGASGAIGGAIARQLNRCGADIAISGTRTEPLNNLAKELGERCFVIPCNLSKLSDADRLIPQAEEKLGQIDILINNAGVTRDGLMVRMSNEDWQKVLDVNLNSVFRLMRSGIKRMIKHRFGRIISITSIVGVTGNPGQTNYAATKAGLIGLSKSLAAEVAARGITVNCVAPGFIDSPMTNVLNKTQKENIISRIPARRIGNPEDIANTVAFLASQEASYITGQTLHVNGGMVMV
jgi:3-oxoacyl-[acyl-carrier protein] reductase